jgi:hypothetical protein
MAKAISLYSGYDSVGRSIQLAEREDGKWFWREYGWNGYGQGWSKWASYGKEPEFPARIANKVEAGGDIPEWIEIPEDRRRNRVSWGWGTLGIIPGPHRLRLPE